MIKCLPCKEILSTHLKAVCGGICRGRNWGIPRALWPVTPAERVSSRFNERPSAQKMQRAIEEDTWHQPLASTYMCTHICVHICKYPHEHMHMHPYIPGLSSNSNPSHHSAEFIRSSVWVYQNLSGPIGLLTKLLTKSPWNLDEKRSDIFKVENASALLIASNKCQAVATGFRDLVIMCYCWMGSPSLLGPRTL